MPSVSGAIGSADGGGDVTAAGIPSAAVASGGRTATVVAASVGLGVALGAGDVLVGAYRRRGRRIRGRVRRGWHGVGGDADFRRGRERREGRRRGPGHGPGRTDARGQHGQGGRFAVASAVLWRSARACRMTRRWGWADGSVCLSPWAAAYPSRWAASSEFSVSVAVSVAVGRSVGLAVTVAVDVAVGVALGVSVGGTVGQGVSDGVSVAGGMSVSVGGTVAVSVGVSADLSPLECPSRSATGDGVALGVTVGVSLGTAVAVGAGVLEGEGVCVTVGV